MKGSARRWLWFGLVLVGLAALLAARLWKPRSAGENGPAAATARPFEVETRVLAPKAIVERLSTAGTILADEAVEIRSELDGVVKQIYFREGARVAAGQLLARLDDAELAAERDRAAQRLELARLSETRQKDLLGQGLISQDGYDRALSQLRVLEAELRLAEAQLAKTEIRVPFDGVIGLRQVSSGASVTPQVRIATLRALDPVKLEFSFPERYAGQVRIGDRVRFRIKSSESVYEGTLYAVEPGVDAETRSLTARARTPNPRGELVPGAFADVELAVRQVADALTVPAIAIIPERGGKKVFVVEDGAAQPRLIETGIRSDTEVQVTAGLAAGDEVIISGVQRLAAGLAVAPRPAAEDPS